MCGSRYLKSLLAVVALLGIAACNSGGGDDNGGTPPPTGSSSFQDYANDQGALDFAAVDPELDANWQARASEAVLAAVTDVSFADVRAANTDNATFPDATWDDAFFQDTAYIGAVGPVGFEQACIDIDDRSDDVTAGRLFYEDSIFDCAGGSAAQEGDGGDAGETAILGSGGVSEVDAMIDTRFASRAADAMLPSATTVTFDDVRTNNTDNTTFPDNTWDDAFFDDTDYIGAVDPTDPNPWWDGWTLHEGSGSLKSETFHPLQAEIEGGTITGAAVAACPTGTTDATQTATIFGEAFPICLLDADLTANTTLTNDHVYLVDGTINVGDGGAQGATSGTVTNVTLTIEAGVQVFGDTTASTAGIVITRGSNVVINGTADQPVVMSSADGGTIDTATNNFSGYNEWGGLIVDGFGVVNEGAEVLSEAAPTGVNRYFGGTDPSDDSGEIHYLVVTESGQEFRLDQEIQGLTLEGVGSGTDIDHVQIHQSGDDGIEWFGGTVNAKYVVITAPDDDGLDMDLGYQGGIQFAIVTQSNSRGDKGIESDGNGDNFDALPRTMPTIANLTIVGDVGKSSATTGGALHREGFGAFIHKAIIADKDAWWEGWTLHEGNGSLKSGTFHPLQAEIEDGTLTGAAVANCPAETADAGQSATIFGESFPICLLNADIDANTTLTNDHVYLVDGTINVGNGGAQGATSGTVSNVTLTIDAGVQVFGDTTSATSGIVITRGSNVVINGTADQPVVMSSADGGNIGTATNNFSGYNEWGGLIVDGFGVVNEGAEVLSEAAPDGVNRYFGGNDPSDDSGEIHYLVVTESGQEFRLDQEIQGLTLEGVGSGTDIDHVQIHQSGDDGIEWFGGTVNAKYVVITAPDDDGLDMDLGYQGGIQFAIVVQSDDRGDKGIESDNNGDNFDATPISMPTIANLTIVGDVGKSTATTAGALHREGFGAFVHKAIITDKDTAGGAVFENGCVDVDDSIDRIDEGTLKYVDAIFNCSPNDLAADEADEAVN